MTTDYHISTQQRRNPFQASHNLMCRTFAPAHGSTAEVESFDARFTGEDAGQRVTDVAFANSFSDLSHFSCVFKKAFQLSPHQVHAPYASGPLADSGRSNAH